MLRGLCFARNWWVVPRRDLKLKLSRASSCCDALRFLVVFVSVFLVRHVNEVASNQF